MKNKNIYYLTIILAIIGFIISIKLLYIDYGAHFIENYESECNINEKVNCETVALSEYAFMFKIPVASWGIMGYLLIALYMIFNKNKKHLYNNLTLFYGLFSVVSLYYFLIAKIKIDSICIYCTATYVINWLNFIILAILAFKAGKTDDKFNIKEQISTFFYITIKTIPIYGIITLGILIPSYLLFQDVNLDHNKQISTEKIKSPYPNGKFNSDKFEASCGNENGKVKIVLFSDYECPFCAKLEENMAKLLTNYKDDVYLIRKEYPLDGSCNMLLQGKEFHKYACSSAYFAKCAGKQNKFWEASEILHKNNRKLTETDLMKYADLLQLDKSALKTCMVMDEVKNAVKAEVLEGIKQQMNSTPTFFINDVKYGKALSYEELEAIVKEILSKK